VLRLRSPTKSDHPTKIKARTGPAARAQSNPEVSLKHRNRDPNSRVPQVKKKISAIDEVDVAVVVVGPSPRPRINDLEIVAAVCEVRTASDNSHVPDGEMMIVSEMLTEMRIVDPAHVFVMAHLIMVLFLPGVTMFVLLLVMVFVLG